MLIDYFLYTSCLPDDADASSVPAIVKQARALNASAGITGVLAFDGECFVQYVEGPPDAVQKLAAALARDTRHTRFKLHTQGSIELAERRFSAWTMGLVDVGRVNASVLIKYSERAVLDPYTVSGKVSMALLEELMATANIVGHT